MSKNPLTLLCVALAASTAAAHSAGARAPTCARDLPSAQAPLHQAPSAETHLLEAVARACAGELPDLAAAARNAARLPRADRSRILGEAAAERLRAQRPGPWELPTSRLPPMCRKRLRRASGVGSWRGADAGTALFTCALKEALGGSSDGRLEPFLRALLLASALDAEASAPRVASP